jgi:[ribosomal protein S5]-alanine N-acetyltransferase
VSEPSAVIHTPRLDLIPMSPALMRALLASDWDLAGRLLSTPIPGEWRCADWHWLGQRPDQAEADPSMVPWLPRVMLFRAGGDSGEQQPVVVGEAGFHGPPGSDGRVEIGYMVVAGHRRRGYAEEAARALLAWATAEHRITRFQANVSPGNTPSLNLIRKLGFLQVGIHRHETRGEELVFHRGTETELPADAP